MQDRMCGGSRGVEEGCGRRWPKDGYMHYLEEGQLSIYKILDLFGFVLLPVFPNLVMVVADSVACFHEHSLEDVEVAVGVVIGAEFDGQAQAPAYLVLADAVSVQAVQDGQGSMEGLSPYVLAHAGFKHHLYPLSYAYLFLKDGLVLHGGIC